MATQIVWTLCPDGIGIGKSAKYREQQVFKLSLLVSPRLTSAGRTTLGASFQDWLDWPSILNLTNFEIANATNGVVAATVGKARSDVWKALFPASTPVGSYEFDRAKLRNRYILSYPVSTIAKGIEKFYTALAAAGGAVLPTQSELLQLRRTILGLPASSVRPGATKKVFLNALVDLASRMKDTPLTNAAGGSSALKNAIASMRSDFKGSLEILRFYHTPFQPTGTAQHKHAQLYQGVADPRDKAKWNTYKQLAALPTPQQLADSIEFHQIVSCLIQFPALARAAGLVIDLEIPVTAPAILGATGLYASPKWTKRPSSWSLPDITPMTVMQAVSATSFRAAPDPALAPGVATGRWLKLKTSGSSSPFDLVQMDVDGAGLKFMGFAEAIDRLKTSQYDDDSFSDETAEPRTGAPSLRSAGLMLAHSTRDTALATAFARADALQTTIASDPKPKLYAEDLIRGYRTDIRDETRNKWYSLCLRDSSYTLLNASPAMTPSAKGEEGMLRIAAATSGDNTSPILKIHEGLFSWRGWSLCAPEPGYVLDNETNATTPSNEEIPPGMPLKTAFVPSPGSLPALRFGRSYRVRVRLVDLAGNSEPYAPGDVAPAEAVSEAEPYLRYEPVAAPDLALIKSSAVEGPKEGESMARLAVRTFNESAGSITTESQARRYVFPPRASAKFAELHGTLDGADGRPRTDLYKALGQYDKPLDTIVLAAATTQPAASATTPAKHNYAVAPESTTMPYLPDPLAAAAVFLVTGVEGINPLSPHVESFYGGTYQPGVLPAYWTQSSGAFSPAAKPFPLVLKAAAANAASALPGQGVTVSLAPAERARVRVSCAIPVPGITKMALARLLAQSSLDAGKKAQLALLIEAGQHWMFTPWRWIELVHAVQKPLIAPQIQSLSAQRKQRDATITITSPMHSKSTGKIDIFGAWLEAEDSTDADKPAVKANQARAFEQTLARDSAPGNIMRIKGIHRFKDTRYRRVFYRVDATTRFREFMPDAIRADRTRLIVSSPNFLKGAPYVAVKSSTPPPAPKILYAVPTFGWNSNKTASPATSHRKGGGLRVYMDRPWFASGFGEMLAVVLPVAGATIAQADIPRYAGVITQWGSDPITPVVSGGFVNGPAPAANTFELAKWHWSGLIPMQGVSPAMTAACNEEHKNLVAGNFEVAGLKLPGGEPVYIAPHAVAYDEERQLWYCDIVITPPAGAYFPFVRLALARYQPNSNEGCNLSSTVMTEFQQLVPDRVAVVVRNGSVARAAVYGFTKDTKRGADFDVQVQVLNAGEDPVLGWRRVEAGNTPAFGGSPPTAAATQGMTLLWSSDIGLPAAPSGGRRRVLITETERYPREDEEPVTRIVYADAFDV